MFTLNKIDMKRSARAKSASEYRSSGGTNTNYSIKAVNLLQQLRDDTWEMAIKYRFDPAIGKIHADYLDKLNTALEGI